MQLSLSPLNPHLYRKFPTASPPSGSFLYLTRVVWVMEYAWLVI
jgi:hypothetical protein